jgi:hypothetical protein
LTNILEKQEQSKRISSIAQTVFVTHDDGGKGTLCCIALGAGVVSARSDTEANGHINDQCTMNVKY